MKKALFIILLIGTTYTMLGSIPKEFICTIENMRIQRAQKMVKLFNGKSKRDKIITAYNAIKGNIDRLQLLNTQIDKTPISRIILDLQSLCSAVYSRKIKLRSMGSLAINSLKKKLLNLNELDNNLYQRTFPLQWKNIIGFLAMQKNFA